MENHPKKSSLRVRVRVTARKRGRELDPCCRASSASDRKRRDREWINNSVRKLQRREIDGFSRVVRGASSSTSERFRNTQLQEEFDTYDRSAHWFLRLQFLKKRSKIIEIVAAKDVIFALAQSGLCAAFSRTTNKRICFLNVSPDEVIRSLFYNKNNDSLITVSVYASDHFSSLKCRTTPIEYIRRNQLEAGFPLFETESLKWPGFVEFDDVNGKVLTYSAQDGIYKVFDLKNYAFLYSISDKNVQEIKIRYDIFSRFGYLVVESFQHAAFTLWLADGFARSPAMGLPPASSPAPPCLRTRRSDQKMKERGAIGICPRSPAMGLPPASSPAPPCLRTRRSDPSILHQRSREVPVTGFITTDMFPVIDRRKNSHNPDQVKYDDQES